MRRAAPPVYRDCPTTADRAWREGRPLVATRWSVWDAGWAVAGALALGLIASLLALFAGVELSGPLILVALTVPWISLAGWPVFVTARRGNGVRLDLGWSFGKEDWRAGILGGMAAFGIAMAVGLLSILIWGDFSSAAGEEAARLAESSPLWALLIFAVLVAVGAPIAEELTFRGLLWSGLAKRGVRPWPTILISAAAFALIHFEPQRLAILLAVGVVLGVIRWRTRSLGACIIAHGVNNLPGALGILALGL